MRVKSNLKEVAAAMRRAGSQVAFATAGALNDVAFRAQGSIKGRMTRVFDRPTPFILRSIVVTKAKEKPVALVSADPFASKSIGMPDNVLRHHVFGGARKLKASERALQRVGILPAGYYLVPARACPRDAYGNVTGGFMRKLLSYFQAMGEQGYRANTTAANRRKMAKLGRTEGGYRTINGVQYFVAYGSLRDGGGAPHLKPGIYSRRGIHGSDIQPVLMFVRKPRYVKRLPFFELASDAMRDLFESSFVRRMAAAVKTAR